MRILVSTANLGAIDDNVPSHVEQLLPQGATLHMVAYDDEILAPRFNALHPRMQAKLPKFLGHELQPGYDYYMWLDGSIFLSHPHSVIWMLAQMGECEMALFRHPFRTSIAEEVAYCLNAMSQGDAYLRDRYRNEPMESQLRAYQTDPDFKDDALFACGVFCYAKSLVQRCPRFLSDWYYHCARHSVQDQISLPFLLQKHKVHYARIDANIFKTPYFGMKQHRR